MTPQNLLILMADEHNPKMLGCAGHPLAKTPHLDALAASGTRFTSAYTTCPICVPARASFATGRYIHDIEYWDNSIAYDGRVPSWGHRLQAAKVPVESIGKLHYRNEADPTGFDRQHVPMHIKDGIGMLRLSIRDQFPDLKRPPQARANIPATAAVGESEYTRYDRKVAEIACAWLREAPKRRMPWVLFVSFVTPHYPLVAPEEFFRLYPIDAMPPAKLGPETGFRHHPWFRNFSTNLRERPADLREQQTALAAYLALCSFVDAQVGAVLHALDESGLRGQTRILYTSDHGENAGARGLWGKSNHYEEATGIPLILAGADVPKSSLCATPVTLADAFPTVLDAVGLAGEAGLPGRSLFEVLRLEDRDRVAFSEYHAAGSPSASYMIRNGRHKLIYYVGFEPELFDLAADPEELNNRAGDPAYRTVLDELQQILRSIVDPEEADRKANDAQRRLIESHGGPDKVLDQLVTDKLYTPVPDAVARQLD